MMSWEEVCRDLLSTLLLSYPLRFDKEEEEGPASFLQFYPTKGGEIILLDVRSELAKALKGVDVNKGTSYQTETARRPDKVLRVDYTLPKVVHHIGKNANYKYVL